jgi:3-oxoacyl-[acyl-carrier-protein] synthase III
MAQKISARITGTGSYTPPTRMTNADFEKILDTSDEWITTRTGIKERRLCVTENNSDMAVAACERAMEMAGCAHDEVEIVIDATVTPDYPLPSNACVVQEKMGLPNAACFDILGACGGFLGGLGVARAFVESGMYKKILVIGSEHLTSIVNKKDRGTYVLFGDGAGAVVVEPTTGDSRIVSTFMKSDGNLREMLWIRTGGSKFPITPEFDYEGGNKVYMNGKELFKVAVREMGRAAVQVIEDAGITAEQVSLVVPHQANLRIIEALVKRLGVDPEKVFLNIHKYGNTSAASVPLALDEANRSGRIKPGDYVLMVAFGGGLFWSSALVKW